MLAAFSTDVFSQPATDLWTDTFKAINFVATSKAAARVGCRPENPLSAAPQYKLLCPNLNDIPDAIIETAALPYLKHHVTEGVARQAIAFWSSDRGKSLHRKIVKEIETGVFNQLNTEDLKMLDTANQTEYGRALNALANDKAQSLAVAQAMLAYVRNLPFNRPPAKNP